MCMLGAGCTTQPTEQENATVTPTPVTTTTVPEANATTAPEEEGTYAFNEVDDNTTVTLPVGSNLTISLGENPTTGYQWNVTSSTGLQYVNDTYLPPETGLVGAGGVHVWEYIAAETGNAEFSAVYTRPWENVTENDTTFSMAFIIE
ncbi:protease inhibitor I42 family protein [Methanoculleus sp. Wushi-C6]|uniref:Protease inhibitor I42 family protein n=1 Tax=Methanoculleus caldifontis TaxID=2651577 RepID=A0ABU3X013_9EURY|nr:protease inhibitor I42 family protein [Methanoculleus sp. Wushi-C6]